VDLYTDYFASEISLLLFDYCPLGGTLLFCKHLIFGNNGALSKCKFLPLQLILDLDDF